MRVRLPENSVMRAVLVAMVASAQIALAQTQTLTFDDLPNPLITEGGSVGYITNGYAGFQWDNFDYNYPALGGIRGNTNSTGYQNGLVSSPYVAFNGYGGPARISGRLFNLDSAYLTAAWNDGLQVEVLGSLEGVLIYDNTYTAETSSPVPINFNYLGIDSVTFISTGGTPNVRYGGAYGTQFVLDNLTVTLVPEPSFPAMIALVLSALFSLRKRRPDASVVA